jgi:hypothetical protein
MATMSKRVAEHMELGRDQDQLLKSAIDVTDHRFAYESASRMQTHAQELYQQTVCNIRLKRQRSGEHDSIGLLCRIMI